MTLFPQIVPEHYQMLATVLSQHTESSVSTSRINIFRGVPLARKVGVSVRTLEFCLCWLDVTDPFQTDGESRSKPFRGFCGCLQNWDQFWFDDIETNVYPFGFYLLKLKRWGLSGGFQPQTWSASKHALGETSEWEKWWGKSRHFELMWGLFLLTVHLYADIIVSVRDGDEWCVRLQLVENPVLCWCCSRVSQYKQRRGNSQACLYELHSYWDQSTRHQGRSQHTEHTHSSTFIDNVKQI